MVWVSEVTEGNNCFSCATWFWVGWGVCVVGGVVYRTGGDGVDSYVVWCERVCHFGGEHEGGGFAG